MQAAKVQKPKSLSRPLTHTCAPQPKRPHQPQQASWSACASSCAWSASCRRRACYPAMRSRCVRICPPLLVLTSCSCSCLLFFLKISPSSSLSPPTPHSSPPTPTPNPPTPPYPTFPPQVLAQRSADASDSVAFDIRLDLAPYSKLPWLNNLEKDARFKGTGRSVTELLHVSCF